MNLLLTSVSQLVKRFPKTLVAIGLSAISVLVLDWATSPPPHLSFGQAQVRNLQDGCGQPQTNPPEDWDLAKEPYYVRQRTSGPGRVTVTLWGTYTTSYRLSGIVKQVDGSRLLVRPTFDRVHYRAGEPQAACIITFGLEVDFTGLSEKAYSVGIAPTPLERLLD